MRLFLPKARNLLGLAVGLVFAFGLQAQAKYPSWKEILESSKYKKTPTTAEVHKRHIKASGDYQLFKISDRYGMLFDPDGYPVVVFDYTMDPLSMKDMFLAGVGIGGWSLKNIWNKYKKIKETPTDIIDKDYFIQEGHFPEPNAVEEQAWQSTYDELSEVESSYSTANSNNEIEGGLKEFAKLKFNDQWISKHGHLKAMGSSDPRSGFSPASFTMADLYVEPKESDHLYEIMKDFSVLVFQKDLKKEDAPKFMTQFQMNWNEATKEFRMVWTPSIGTFGEKQPPIPGFVLYYYDIYNILAYKFSLHNMARNSMYYEAALGRYGSILGMFISRITNGLRSQMDFHENGLLSLFEAYQRGEYDINIPWEDGHDFVDQSITLLYLNKLISDKHLEDETDGVEKRRFVESKEAEAKADIIKWLEKKKYTVMEWSDGRNATVFKGEKKKGIVNLTIGRHWLTRQPSFVHYENATWYKSAQRLLLEVFVDAVRFVMPSYLNFGKWLSSWVALNIQVYIPTAFWDEVFKARQFTEIAYEGTAFIKVNEAIAGRWMKVPGYTVDELASVKSTLGVQRMNPFEVPLKYEAVAIKTNRQYVLDLIGQGKGMTGVGHVIP